MIVEEPVTGAAVVERTLASARASTLEALLEYLPDGEHGHRLYEIAAEYPLRSSKGIRPALCLAACRAYGEHGRGARGGGRDRAPA